MKTIHPLLTALLLGITILMPAPAHAGSADQIDADARKALKQVLANNAEAQTLMKKAEAVLVFPKIVKGGFVFGGAFGEGALIEDSRSIGYFSTASASYGFQAGIEEYGYAIFFMDDDSLSFLKRGRGWSIGAGPQVTVLNAGFTKNLSTTNLQNGVYAIFFSQKGLMGGASLSGSKITRIFP